MPKCIIDGKEAVFTEGENLVDVAKRVGVEVPVFCYHPGLSVVAQCRMCLVEIEKNPKLQTGCSTKAAEGMIVKTQSEAVKKARSSMMEFLLINHPLDCPVCDKSGECDLQDNSFKYGSSHMRTTEDRRTYVDLDMGPVIKKNMNRCIHCTRCIRFGDEIAGIREMVALQRGNSTEISTIDGRALETDYAGNYSDICPTGSLTIKDFRFNKRVWFLKKTPSICEGCSRGCNIEVHHEGNEVYRCIPRTNLEVNQHWICDEGRFHFRSLQNPARLVAPRVNRGGVLNESTWDDSVQKLKTHLSGKKVLFLIGSDLTQEEAGQILVFVKKNYASAHVAHFGTTEVNQVSRDADADKILKRKSKTANLNGLELLGVAPLGDAVPQADCAVVFSGGRAELPAFLAKLPWFGVGVFFDESSALLPEIVLPGLNFLEKEGTFINYSGREQKIKRALLPTGKSKALSEVLMIWAHSKLTEGVQ